MLKAVQKLICTLQMVDVAHQWGSRLPAKPANRLQATGSRLRFSLYTRCVALLAVIYSSACNIILFGWPGVVYIGEVTKRGMSMWRSLEPATKLE